MITYRRNSYNPRQITTAFIYSIGTRNYHSEVIQMYIIYTEVNFQAK